VAVSEQRQVLALRFAGVAEAQAVGEQITDSASHAKQLQGPPLAIAQQEARSASWLSPSDTPG